MGRYIQFHRLEQNKSQQQVSEAAGISCSTLSLLEHGETVTLHNFLKVLRVLKLLHICDAFVIHQTYSPLALAKLAKKERKRSRNNQLDEPPI
jgi:transcriptional regulator with XRE-family HTH domain